MKIIFQIFVLLLSINVGISFANEPEKDISPNNGIDNWNHEVILNQIKIVKESQYIFKHSRLTNKWPTNIRLDDSSKVDIAKAKANTAIDAAIDAASAKALTNSNAATNAAAAIDYAIDAIGDSTKELLDNTDVRSRSIAFFAGSGSPSPTTFETKRLLENIEDLQLNQLAYILNQHNANKDVIAFIEKQNQQMNLLKKVQELENELSADIEELLLINEIVKNGLRISKTLLNLTPIDHRPAACPEGPPCPNDKQESK